MHDPARYKLSSQMFFSNKKLLCDRDCMRGEKLMLRKAASEVGAKRTASDREKKKESGEVGEVMQSASLRCNPLLSTHRSTCTPGFHSCTFHVQSTPERWMLDKC